MELYLKLPTSGLKEIKTLTNYRSEAPCMFCIVNVPAVEDGHRRWPRGGNSWGLSRRKGDEP